MQQHPILKLTALSNNHPLSEATRCLQRVNGNEHDKQEHSRVAITISIDSSEQAKYNGPTYAQHIQAEVSAIADTGAQSDVCGRFQTSWHMGSHIMIYCLLIWSCQQLTDHLSLLKGHFLLNLQQSLIMVKRNHAAP